MRKNYQQLKEEVVASGTPVTSKDFRPILKLNNLLTFVGIQYVYKSLEYFYAWFIKNRRYHKVFLTKEEVLNIFDITEEELDNPEHYWVTKQGISHPFLLINTTNPKKKDGNPIKLQVLETIEPTEELKIRLKTEPVDRREHIINSLSKKKLVSDVDTDTGEVISEFRPVSPRKYIKIIILSILVLFALTSFDWLTLIKSHEGLRLEVYEDIYNNPTIGYGHLLKKNENFTKISIKQADSLLVNDFNAAVGLVKLHHKDTLTENEAGALGHLVFSIGIGNYLSSDLYRNLLNNASKEKIYESWMQHIYINGNLNYRRLYNRNKEYQKFYEL